MSHLYCHCLECKPELNEEQKHVYELTQMFLTLENFFAQTEGKVPKLPVGHAITRIKLQGEEIALLTDSVRAFTESKERLEKVILNREHQLQISMRECDDLRYEINRLKGLA